MAWYRMRSIGSGGGVTPIGDATDGDVLSGKTYMNANGASTGTMTNRGAVSQTLDTTTTSYTVPEGYHNGSGTVSITTETKTITAGTSASTTSATSGKVISSVTVNPTPSQTKSASPSTSAQTISPDSGKLLSSVSISAISPVRASGGGSATLTGQNSTGPYVYFPYGWYPQAHATYGSWVYMTAAQAVTACPSQEATSTPTTRSATAATVTPDSGKLLSKVTVNTNSVPNSNSGTKTITSSDTNWYTGNVDMGATNTYRYVNAVNVYNKGKSDGQSVVPSTLEITFGGSSSSQADWMNITINNFVTMGYKKFKLDKAGTANGGAIAANTYYNLSNYTSSTTLSLDAYGAGHGTKVTFSK